MRRYEQPSLPSLAIETRFAEIITRAQAHFIRAANPRDAFDGVLHDLLSLTDSEYGFIGEVLYQADGSPYLKTYAITNIAWNDETRAFYEANAPQGMEFFNLKTLFGAALTTGEPVIANEPGHDPRRGGLPAGHPALNAFLGVPIHHAGELIAMAGLANRPDGFTQALLDQLSPLMVMLGQLVHAARTQRQREEDKAQQKADADRIRVSEQRLAAVIQGANIGTWEWNIQTGDVVLNKRWAEIVGYTLDELGSPSIQTWLSLGHPDDMKMSSQLLDRHFRRELDYYDVQFRMRHKAGHWAWVHARGSVVSWADDGKPLMMYGTHTDISAQKQAEQSLKESEKQFRSLVDNIPGITYRCLLDEHWTMLYMSDQVDPLSGYPASDFIRNAVRSYASVIHPDDRQPTDEAVQAALRDGSDQWLIEYRILHRDGRIRWAQERGTVIRDLDWTPLYLDGFILDITAAKQASEALRLSEDRLRALFELSPLGIALNDHETGDFLNVNEALIRPTGYTREEFIALSYWDLTPQAYEQQERQQLALLEQTGRYGPYEKEYIRKDGSRYPVVLNGMVVRDQSGRQLIWSIVEDISERKRIERMKSEFVSTVSHELRTPLTSISGSLGLIAGGALGALPPAMRPMVDIAHKNSLRLTHLINDLLDMDKLIAGKLQFDMKTQALTPLIAHALHSNQAYADQHGVRLVRSGHWDEVNVHVDGQRLQQVMANLLSNASKFSPHGAEVVVDVQRLNGWARVSVRDHGPGIPDDFRARIFEKFSQADSSDSRQKGGSGLGLAITRELIERMDGTISFDSTPGQGSVFYFELPLAAEGLQA